MCDHLVLAVKPHPEVVLCTAQQPQETYRPCCVGQYVCVSNSEHMARAMTYGLQTCPAYGAFTTPLSARAMNAQGLHLGWCKISVAPQSFSCKCRSARLVEQSRLLVSHVSTCCRLFIWLAHSSASAQVRRVQASLC